MALTRILLWLGNSFVLAAIILAITAFAGALFLEPEQAISFAVMALLIGVLGALFILLTHNTPARETNADALLFLILFWLIMPVITAVPFALSGEVDTLLRAYFESVSAITTTGASTLKADELPRTLLFWRSLLQWFGGVSAATFAVVILAALNLSGTGIHRSMLFTMKKGELFQRLIGIGRVIALLVRIPATRGIKPLYNNIEHRGLFVISGILILLGIVFALPEELGTVIPEAIYFATSTGYDYHVIGIDMIPPAPLIAIALIGGAALSTSGGVKIIRLLLLFRHLGTDLGRLSHPSRIIPV